MSRLLHDHLAHAVIDIEQTHNYITKELSRLGKGCVICGTGQHVLQRPTICGAQACHDLFKQVNTEILLSEIWQDPLVADLLISAIHAAAWTGNAALLVNPPADLEIPRYIVNVLSCLPAVSDLRDIIQSCLHVYGDNFRLASALSGLSNPSGGSALASCLLWIFTSHRSFILSAPKSLRIPFFGSHQFLLVNSAPELEIAFSQHMPTHDSASQVLFHGTSPDRLYAILCQGLRIQNTAPLRRTGASFGSGIYVADEPSVAGTYANVPTTGWGKSQLTNKRILLGCELAGEKPPAASTGIYVIQDPSRLAVRYIFLLDSSQALPAAKDVRIPMQSVFRNLRKGTL